MSLSDVFLIVCGEEFSSVEQKNKKYQALDTQTTPVSISSFLFFLFFFLSFYGSLLTIRGKTEGSTFELRHSASSVQPTGLTFFFFLRGSQKAHGNLSSHYL